MKSLIDFVQRQIDRVAADPDTRFLLTEGFCIPEVNTNNHSASQLLPVLEHFRANGYPKTRVTSRGLTIA